MRPIYFVLLLMTTILIGCGPKSNSVSPSLPLNQFMGWVIDPNADVIWDSVKSITDINGTKEIYPKTDAEWESVRNSAATLVEAGNLLISKSKKPDDKQWAAYANQLSQSAMLALKASQDKNKDTLFDAGGEIYNACKSCHDKYADFDKN
jgi:formylglycine-generating enzyme required for sulfatase activity